MIDVAASSQRKRSKNISDGCRFTLFGLISQRPSVATGDRVPAMRFVFPHSHAFRRGRVTVDDDQKSGPGCLVEFGDGVTVIAEWYAVGNAIHLSNSRLSYGEGNAGIALDLASRPKQGRPVEVGAHVMN